MKFSIQVVLENERVKLVPVVEDDFEELYEVASDRKIWEQHPNSDRWQRSVFKKFFDGALESRGAFKVIDKESGKVAGCTRYYNYNEQSQCIYIGYTFLSANYWGQGINSAVKKLMLDYIFQFLDTVYFQVGANNIRSQIAMARIGAKLSEKMPDEGSILYELSRNNLPNGM